MGQVLYRKYRSRKLSEIVGQEHITDTLEKALKQGRIAHAYLFTGPRGVGKTSVARILAHEINDLPYSEETPHIDIIEIDAASNRRIDEIRDLRDKVYIAPAQAKYKVYIIDEVHMLTREAFNALLKTLEEPPEHVVFILATTEAHKLPETIISRTQRYQFRPIETQKVIKHLKTIAKQEKIGIEDEALVLIAEHGEGSFRDSISLLDQAAARGEKITVDVVREMLGIPPTQAIDELLAELGQTGNAAAVVQRLQALYSQGYQASIVAHKLGAALREQLVEGSYAGKFEPAGLLTKLLQVPASHDPERYLEIVLLETALPAVAPSMAVQPVAKQIAADAKPAMPAPQRTAGHRAPSEPAKLVAPAETNEPAPTQTATKPYDDTTWTAVLDQLKKRYNTLYSIARMASPRLLDDGTLELGLAFAFHQKRLNEAKNRKIISDAIVAVTSKPMEIICVLDESLKPGAKTKSAPAKTDPSLSAISNIFGGGELLQS